jgi:hypothetical protein
LRAKPARSDIHAGRPDETNNNSPSDCSAADQVPEKGRSTANASDYSVSFELPENIPISEHELRALETLLGLDLKKLLADSTFKALI